MERDALRTCKDCGFSSSNLSRFVKNKQSKHGYRNLCISCAVERNNKEPKKKEWKTNHQTKKRYNIDVETYNRLMATTNCCEICGNTEQLCYDHDHITMKFRGVLCRACNRSLGQLGDSLEAVQRVLKYLERTK